LASSGIDDPFVADAPADYDEVVETVPLAPGWVRVLVFVSALVLSWTLIILVAVTVRHAASKPRPRPGRDARGPAATFQLGARQDCRAFIAITLS
jgi:hypothetical protein